MLRSGQRSSISIWINVIQTTSLKFCFEVAQSPFRISVSLQATGRLKPLCESRVQLGPLGVEEKKNLEGAQVTMKLISVLRSKTVVLGGKTPSETLL